MTTQMATAAHHNLDLANMTLGQQTRLLTTEDTNWYIRRHDRHPEEADDAENLAGFYVQSDDPTWIQLQGQGFCKLSAIGRYIAEGRTYCLGGFELHVAEVHSTHRREI